LFQTILEGGTLTTLVQEHDEQREERKLETAFLTTPANVVG